MSSNLKWSVALALVFVFCTGVAVGVFGAAWHVHQHLGAPVALPGMPGRMRQHLQHELKLTPEQAAKIGPIVDRTAAELEEIRRTTNQRVLEVLNKGHAEVAPLLTPEQQARLNQLEERHRHALHTMAPP